MTANHTDHALEIRSAVEHLVTDAGLSVAPEWGRFERELDTLMAAFAAAERRAEALYVVLEQTEAKLREEVGLAEAAEDRADTLTRAVRECLHEAGYGGGNHDRVRDKIVGICRDVLAAGDGTTTLTERGGGVAQPPASATVGQSTGLEPRRTGKAESAPAAPRSVSATPEHREKVSRTFDSELDARIHAQSLWDRRRKALVMTTLDWNQANPDRKVRTANRYVVIEEVR